MQNTEFINFAISRLTKRINTHTFWRWVSIYALFGVGFAVLLVSVSRIVEVPVPLLFTAISIVALSLIAGATRGLIGFISQLEAAKAADSKLYLQERLSTALEISGKERKSEMAELQLDDAAEFARSLDPKVLCPRMFPLTAKLLPLAIIALAALFFIPPLYIDSAEISPVVREAIKKAGSEIESAAEDADKNLISDDLRKLASEMKQTGDELKQKPVAKKDALKDLSNLARKMEAMKIIAEVSKGLESDMTPEKKRILNELLAKLADNLRDIRGMEELSKKVIKAQQMDLSTEALKELAAALDDMRFGNSDMKALQQMSDQVAKAKHDIGRIIPVLAQAMDSGGSQQDEEGFGRMGGAAPGRNSFKGDGLNSSPQDYSGQGYDSELEGQLSEKGRSLPARLESDLEKGQSFVPYQEIYVKYRDAADDAIASARIPWTYREQVKRYFDGIKKYDDGN